MPRTHDQSTQENRRGHFVWFALALFLVFAVVALIVGYAYSEKSVVLLGNNRFIGFYRGFGWDWRSEGIFGRVWARTKITEDDGSWRQADVPPYGYVPFQGFYPDGTLRAEGLALVEDLGDGNGPLLDPGFVKEVKCYDPAGRLISEVKNGQGKTRILYSDGSLYWQTTYVNGQRVDWIQNYPDGTLNRHVKFDSQGDVHGRRVSNYENGKPMARGEYKHGEEIGLWYSFHEDGSVSKIEDHATNPPTEEEFSSRERLLTEQEEKKLLRL